MPVQFFKFTLKPQPRQVWLLLITTILFLMFYILHSPAKIVYAQNFDIASTYDVVDKDAVSGDIISSSEKGLVRSELQYDNKIFGVLQDNPVIVYSEASQSGKAIVRNGDAEVNISDFNGNIAIGDYITSSPVKGYGMKATQSGYVIGVVTAAPTPGQTINFQNRQLKTGTVMVAMKIEYAELSTPRNANHLLEALGGAFFRNVQDPERFTQVMKAIIAGMIAITSFAVGFFAFTRAIAKGVEAIGRNPLAKRAIQLSIIMQLILTVLTALAGLAGAFVILRL